MSKGGAEPNSPRHRWMVRTCCRFSFSTYATMHSGWGSSPASASILEIDDDDLVEVSAAHVGSCLAPIRRSRPGCVSSMIMRPAKVRSISSLSG